MPGQWRQVVDRHTNLLDPGCLTADQATQVGTEVQNSLRDYFQMDTGRVPARHTAVIWAEQSNCLEFCFCC